VRRPQRLAALVGLALLPGASLHAGERLFGPEGNRLRVYELGAAPGAPADTVLIERASLDPARGRDVNGMVCPLPDASGRFVAGEDTGQPAVPGGWGIFERDGSQVGKLTATSFASRYPEPYGCAFDGAGRLFVTELGDPGFSASNGQLILWFPPYQGQRSEGYCKLAVDLGTPTGIAIDRHGRVYVAAASQAEILRFSPPFPSGPDAAGGCGRRDASGAPLADVVAREVFADAEWTAGLVTYAGLAFSPRGTLYAASVATGRIGEFDADGRLLRVVLAPAEWLPPFATGTPQGLAVDGAGRLYYADLDLRWRDWTLAPGPDGKVWRIDFDATGAPLAPRLLRGGLRFPDGLAVLPGE
jgi:DNA-binding beta-propeller fold protein YncE